MKKYILGLFFVYSGICINAQSVTIRQASPFVLQIDGAGDNSVTPTAAQIANDVVIDSKGNVGIGTHLPQAKLSIDNTNSAVKALQIIDGFQAEGQLLTSDADGNAFWSYPVPSTGKIEATLNLGTQTITAGATTKLDGSAYTAKSDGYHVFEIRWYATYSLPPSRQRYTATHLRLFKNNLLVDEFEAYEDVTIAEGDAVSFFTSLAVGAVKGDQFYLDVRPGIAPGSLILSNTAPLTTSKIIVKRLNFK